MRRAMAMSLALMLAIPAVAQDQIGGAALTILLVLYPALASVAIVVVTFLLSGRGVFA